MHTLALFAALLSNAHAAETRVFVSEFQPMDSRSATMAALLAEYLHEQLEKHPEIDVVLAESAPPFGETSAELYVQSCPPDNAVGCAFIVAGTVDADYAITGTVTQTDDTRWVDVVIIDIVGSREAVSFRMDVRVGDDAYLAKSIEELLLGVIHGEEGVEEDIRELGLIQKDTQAIDKKLVAEQLAQLNDELGEITGTRTDREIQREEYTEEDVLTEMESDATKPWDRLGMTPGEYMDYKNSGMTLTAWRNAAAGRRFQVIVRGTGGLTRAAVGTSYYGHYALDASTGEVPEAYAWETRVGASAPQAGLWVGFGLTPVLEADLGVGYVGGPYAVEIQQQVLGNEFFPKEGETYRASNLWFGGRVLAVFSPVKRAHPVAGGGVWVAMSSPLDAHVLPPPNSNLPVFPRSSTVSAQALGGVEVNVNPILDLYAHVPIGVVVGGRTVSTFSEGSGVIESRVEPTEAAPFSAALEVGFSLRFLGGVKESSGIERFEEDY